MGRICLKKFLIARSVQKVFAFVLQQKKKKNSVKLFPLGTRIFVLFDGDAREDSFSINQSGPTLGIQRDAILITIDFMWFSILVKQAQKFDVITSKNSASMSLKDV